MWSVESFLNFDWWNFDEQWHSMHSLVAVRCSYLPILALYSTVYYTAPLTLSHVVAGSVYEADIPSRSVTHHHSKHGSNLCALPGVPNAEYVDHGNSLPRVRYANLL